MDEATASLMTKAGIGAYFDRDSKRMLVRPDFAKFSPTSLSTINRHADAFTETPSILECNCPPAPGPTETEVVTTTYSSGTLYDDSGLPIGAWSSYSTNTYYYASYEGGGTSASGPIYYPPSPPKIPTCTIAAGGILLGARQAAQYITQNPGDFEALSATFARAGMSAVGMATAYLDAGTATASGAIGFIVELCGALTATEWGLLGVAVVSIAVIAAEAYQCLHGD
jgi:hypothetical protein